jgi:peptide/nickel transport system substrate-binding protein
MELLTVGTGDNAVEQLLQADAAARGIRLTIRQMEMGSFLARARAGAKDFDAIVTGIPGDLTLAHLASMYDGRLRGSALDYGGFHTPRLDSLFVAVSSASDGAEVAASWAAVQRELLREAPAAWLYHARGVQGVSRRLQGVTMDLRGELATLSKWHFADGDGDS